MEFEQRLQKAIQRGRQLGNQRRSREEAEALNEEDLKSLHSKHRLVLSEKIESCAKQLQHHFPGFQFETIFGERGWGAAVSRDDIQISSGKRSNRYSRLEMTIRPFSEAHVLDLAVKGTIHNKEIFNQNHFEKISETDQDSFVELIDLWVLEYAELYSAKGSS
ncbi:MAG: hypothetical protein CMJ81_19790 [Planctomycetaceae bacterium]|jgi:hypothetical protein|nr:hypothetical protein [Planctomycetaceae bacterium]MBP60003.1 hypothetical protein [Planctomycetaceae bacterium]